MHNFFLSAMPRFRSGQCQKKTQVSEEELNNPVKDAVENKGLGLERPQKGMRSRK